ncbi:serine hydrolase domain-containing protein [Tessaracoccus antarcticus]|uniref:Class A beta-lactamase-related serine hydrolase n=1 Tax=Tessaracoccus antarcticus TaxID=2479848 RepID=A0A3M0G4L9_9ACTN|nr:serine hydrolase domain-containing protein [Tessaracoccus antarcticus]RMB59951.1 class A beta-lactamase-related serine hydrolase [Tessaracoccus antarcticus]
MTSLSEMLHRVVASGLVPGAVGQVGGRDADVVVAGVTAVGGRALEGNEIFRIQSMTKAITTVAALRLVEAGRIGLDSAVDRWLPELTTRRVLTSPGADLADTVPAVRAITLRHLLTNGSGYGSIFDESPLKAAMLANGTEAGAEPLFVGADEWLGLLADLPLAFQPGQGWRYHHSFGVLGILLSRLTGLTLGDLLAEDLLGPLGMHDTGFWVPEKELARLPAAYRYTADGFVELEPAGGGFYAGTPPFDVSHGELVSTVHDYGRFLRMLADGGVVDGRRMLSEEHLHLMTTDQVPASNKTPDSFFSGFWNGTGWGYGVAVQTGSEHRGRYGWSGGLGTDFFVDPDGTTGILLTQVELDGNTMPMVGAFQELA